MTFMAGRNAPQLKLNSGIHSACSCYYMVLYICVCVSLCVCVLCVYGCILCVCVCVYNIYVLYYKYFACCFFLKFVTSFIVLHFDICF